MLNQARSEFYLCLARAFLAPVTPASFTAMREHLAADLEDLGATLGYPIAAPLRSYREAMAALPDQEHLLVTYSRLFLVPASALPAINAATYLDGTLNGGSVAALEDLYRRCGLAPDRACLHDLPDHVSVQLELVAYLYAAAATRDSGEETPELPVSAEDFLGSYVSRWAPGLHADLARATGRLGVGANPYLPLAAVLEAAVTAETGLAEWPNDPASTGRPSEGPRPGRAALGLSEADLEIIRQRLRAYGLSADHVMLPPGEGEAEAIRGRH